MTIGVLGLGKLGLPWALAVQAKGHSVYGKDIRPVNGIVNAGLGFMVKECEIIFLIVQTPHTSLFEGSTKLPESTADFDYTYLKKAVTDVAKEAKAQKKKTIICVVSTCLPGTFENEIEPLLNKYIRYTYSPSFTATGSVEHDLFNAEFNLIGYYEGIAAAALLEFYETLNNAEPVVTDITTAEAIKMSYNTFVTTKTVIANIWGEIAARMNLNFDDIYKAWSLSTNRIISNRYLKAGMSDGGPCHPRDNIALSHLAKDIGLSHDIFRDLMMARQDYESWHADNAITSSKKNKLPLILLGKGFKPETDITTGSAAMLLAELIKEKGYPFEHHEDLEVLPKAVYFIATDNIKYDSYKFPKDSIIINPAGFHDAR